MTKRFWNDDDEIELASLIRDGHPVDTIAAMVGRTPNSIMARAQILRLRFAPGQRGPKPKPRPVQSTAYQRIFE